MKAWLGLERRLQERGVLGVNGRNAEYTLVYNRRDRYPLVDDKVKTKQLASEAGIAVPELYGLVEIEHQVRDVATMVANRPDFVVKPARGSQGEGILIITGRSRRDYVTADGRSLDEDELRFHVSSILSGIYSLGGQLDVALIEYRVDFDPVFAPITYRGVPDIRIIVFCGVPVMAMVRLPTRASRGKANLHQGAIGAGIDIATGTTLHAVSRTGVVREHPDTGNAVAGLRIPHWETLLELAARSYELTGLGYQGIDVVLDRNKGPMLLELNARPGLSIQIANRSGLKKRLEVVERERTRLRSIGDRVALARERFAAC
jgi:alpha-L-glutamate ligase-like protein